MGFELLGYGGHPCAEPCPKKGRRPSLKARIIQLFKPKCFWVDEMDRREELINEERKKDPREEQHLNLRRWLVRVSEKDSPARFPTVVVGEDESFSPESRDGFSLNDILRIHEGRSSKRLMVSPLRRCESVEKKKTVQFRFPIDSVIIYSPDLDLEEDNFKC